MTEVLCSILFEFDIPTRQARLIKTCLNETYIRVCLGKYSSDDFRINSELKQEDAFLPLYFNFALEREIRMIQADEEVLKLNGTNQLLLYADDVNILV
jgi:hypothetical protein